MFVFFLAFLALVCIYMAALDSVCMCALTICCLWSPALSLCLPPFTTASTFSISFSLYTPLSHSLSTLLYLSLLSFCSSICLPYDFSLCQLRPDIWFHAASSRTDRQSDRGSNMESSGKRKKRERVVKLKRPGRGER